MSSKVGSSHDPVVESGAHKDAGKKRRITAVAVAVARILPCVTFVLGVTWIFLFPLVTITTGEAKPRGTFFDENAMLVHHTVLELQTAEFTWAQPESLRKTYPPEVIRCVYCMCK